MKHVRFLKLGLLAAILTPVTPYVFGQEASPQVQAADAPAAPAKRTNDTTGDTTKLDTVIVTASPVAGGVRKLQASFSVTTANAEQIKQTNAKSTADLLKAAPGVWAEASGGQTGANIFVAGFPGGGDAPFFTTMINGSPLYGAATLSFLETSSMMRLDDTVERVEILQGGPAATFGPGQMGATANFILKHGTDTPSGSIGLTYGNEGLYRLDAFYGAKVAEGWYANYMDGKYTHREACNPYTDINGQAACASFNGNPLQRQPKLQFRFSPSYKLMTDWGDLTGWLNYEHVGNRYSDQTAQQELGSYYTLGAGLLANVGKNWEFRMQATNLTNQIAITEGNPRVTGSNVGANSVILARPIEGREVNFGAKYKF